MQHTLNVMETPHFLRGMLTLLRERVNSEPHKHSHNDNAGAHHVSEPGAPPPPTIQEDNGLC